MTYKVDKRSNRIRKSDEHLKITTVVLKTEEQVESEPGGKKDNVEIR